jgi:hypothetical protein
MTLDKHTCTLKATLRFNRRAYNIMHEVKADKEKGMNPDLVELEALSERRTINLKFCIGNLSSGNKMHYFYC